MKFSFSFRALVLLAAAVVAGCGGGETLSPSNEPPASVAPISDLTRSAVVGEPINGGLVVKVTDAAGRPVAGVNVAFAVTLGNGQTNPRLAPTNSHGEATSTWTIGTIVGDNEVTASVTGVSGAVRFRATGTPGVVRAVSLSTPTPRLLANVDTTRITAKALDAFGNATSPAPTFTVRDPSLLTIDNAGLVRALKRGSDTWVVASASGKSDSVRITVLAPGQSICTNAANPVTLAVGQVITDISANGFCVHANGDPTEYAIVPFYMPSVTSATTQVEVRGQGVSPLAPVASVFERVAAVEPMPATIVPDYARESRMRTQERVEGPARASAARQWMGAHRNVIGGSLAAVVPAIGDLMKLNVNAVDYCDKADYRIGRVAAITSKAIIVADTANPTGGFTSDEYRSFGVTFDTLIDPTDRKAFGDPSDIDNNGHVIIFFTRAVNELTPRGSGSAYLGFFYQRDLFPTTGTGACAGSNFGEVVNLLVPDPDGVASDKRTKEQVLTFTLGTVAHEYQHLINASRRLYINKFGDTFEEKWLDEGLAHIAEDINFWPSSRRARGTNIGASVYLGADPVAASAYSSFVNLNALRYAQYLARTEGQAPIGLDMFDDDLYTRGAIWNFLRYAADRIGPDGETQFWTKLVNTNAVGLPNLANALGSAPGPWLRDWALSVFLDDNVASGLDARFRQPSYNLRSLLTRDGTSSVFPLFTRQLRDNVSSAVNLTAYGVSFLRFAVVNGQDALLTVTSGGQPLPPNVSLSIVRVR